MPKQCEKYAGECAKNMLQSCEICGGNPRLRWSHLNTQADLERTAQKKLSFLAHAVTPMYF